MTTRAYLAWVGMVLGIAAWGGLVWTSLYLVSQGAVRAAHVQKTDASVVERASRARAAIVAQATTRERANLERLAAQDASSIIRAIEQAGKDAGVPVKIGQVIAPQETENSIVHSPAFVIEATGSFASLVRVAELLDSLPIPSRVEQFQLSQAGGTDRAKRSWILSVRVQVMTTDSISS